MPAVDTKMLLGIPFPVNSAVVIDQLALNLVDIRLDKHPTDIT